MKYGTLEWDAAANSQPTVSMFNDYHQDATLSPISFSDDGLNGIEIEYIDNNGITWLSRETDPGQEATFNILSQASDNTGDYSLFECNFTCKVWRFNAQTSQEESLDITNAKFTSWFKR